MKRSGALVLLVAAAFLMSAGCGASTVSADPSRPAGSDAPVSLTKVLTGVGFRTDTPAGWVIRHTNHDGVDSYRLTRTKHSTASEGAFEVTRLPFSAVPSSVVPHLDLAQDPLVDLLPKIVAGQPGRTNVTDTVGPHDLILASESAASMTMTFDEGTVHLTRQTTVVRHGKALYELDVTSSPPTFLSVLAIFEQSEDRIIWT